MSAHLARPHPVSSSLPSRVWGLHKCPWSGGSQARRGGLTGVPGQSPLLDPLLPASSYQEARPAAAAKTMDRTGAGTAAVTLQKARVA